MEDSVRETDPGAASGAEAVLSPNEMQALRELAAGLPERFPPIVDAEGRPAPADIEFGFLKGRLVLPVVGRQSQDAP
ncbi:MAG: hypothetical protein M3461_20630 [Pseudomonadota bacterium]|nr:hypothetical protein [Pseudomonadota bacterium]